MVSIYERLYLYLNELALVDLQQWQAIGKVRDKERERERKREREGGREEETAGAFVKYEMGKRQIHSCFSSATVKCYKKQFSSLSRKEMMEW